MDVKIVWEGLVCRISGNVVCVYISCFDDYQSLLPTKNQCWCVLLRSNKLQLIEIGKASATLFSTVFGKCTVASCVLQAIQLKGCLIH